MVTATMTNAETIGWCVTAIAVAGVLLNNRLNRACFILWMVSNTLSATLHMAAGQISLTARDAAFFALAIHGWFAWGCSESSKKTPRPNKPTRGSE